MLRLGCMARLGITVIALLLIIVLVPYLRYTAFEDEVLRPFHGEHWYVPYAHLSDSLYKANFHAHSRAWAGITWGEHSTGEVIEAYAQHGYRVPTLSNYHKITGPEYYPSPLIHIPAYEHGLNLKKVHCLCIGAEEVSYFEYPWHFSINHTRETIRRLRKHCKLVALAHPGARQAHTPQEMVLLTGLQLMEVSNTMGVRPAFWDSTLSAGNAVWLLSNDDTHDLLGKELFVRWNMIYAPVNDPDSILLSCARGNHYGVLSYDRQCEDNRLTDFRVERDTLFIALRDTCNRLDLFGQGGKLVATQPRCISMAYPLAREDTYVRAEIHHDHCVMYLNPVVRYDGVTLPFARDPDLRVDRGLTWTGRGATAVLIGIILWMWAVFVKPFKRKGS